MSFYYAVAKGRKPGIYHTWDECKSQVNKFPGPVFKKFHTSAEAQAFIDSRGQCLQNSSPLSNSANTTSYSRPKPSHVVPLGGKGSRASSKRVWESPESNENSTVASAKRKKTVESKEKVKTVKSKEKVKTVKSKDKVKTVKSKDKVKTVESKDKVKTVESKDKVKTVESKDKVKTVESKDKVETVESKDKSKKHFDMDSDGWVNVWTDGACSSNGNHGAKAGVGVYFGDDSPLNVSEPVVGRATNNMAEIQAVTRAAEKAREAGITKMRINTDSEFLIKSATQWMPGWKRRGWMTAANKPVINRQELEEMESALKPLAVQWNHVRGHQGIYGNEQADQLARKGAQRYGK